MLSPQDTSRPVLDRTGSIHARRGRLRNRTFPPRPGGAWLLRWTQTTWWRVANKRRVARWYLRHWIRGIWTWVKWTRSESTDGGSLCRPLSAAADPLSISPFDLRIWNPIRWRRIVDATVGSLGPLEWLPPHIKAHKIIHKGDLFGLRRVHHVEDLQAFHADVATRAGDLVRLAATGTVVHLADSDPRLEALLGGGLYGLMSTDTTDIDADTRELRSIRMRRIALRNHSLQTYVRECEEDTLPDSPDLPLVSVLLATKRPWLLQRAVAGVARQTYPRLELVLALHGRDFVDVERRIAAFLHPVKVVHLPIHEPLGTVLNAATDSSSGILLTKMDDDDLYGADHVWDLVLAYQYSQAQLVGKGLEFVYLSAADKTIHQSSGYGEDYRAMTVAGGTLLISRRDLDRVGGWRRQSGSVDLALIEDVLQTRGSVYRTHGAGFMLVRSRHSHTWEMPDEYFLAGADTIECGWNPALADLGDLNLPHPTSGDGD